jgi:uncharacterized membrane protein YqaE (UPF0057 family)
VVLAEKPKSKHKLNHLIFMKQILLTVLCAIFFCTFSNASVQPVVLKASDFKQVNEITAMSPEIAKMGIEKFLTMTPSDYKEITGQKLGIKKSIQLKIAQKQLKKQLQKDELRTGGDGITKGLYILMAIFGIAWIAMGVKSDWSGSDWIVNILLTVLCWLPGVIHALIKMKDYYK